MNFRLFPLALAALFAGTAWAQPVSERVLTFRYAESPGGMQEIFNMVRSTGDIQDATLDRATRTITMRGAANQLDAGEWTFRELDRPAAPSAGMHEFHPTGMGDTVISVYSLARIDTPQGMQESVNAVRSVTDIQRVFPVNSVHAIAMRGTASQISLGQWLFQELDQPSPATANTVAHGRAVEGSGDTVARVFFLVNVHSPQALQETVNATRSIADVQRFFPFQFSSAIVMRGSTAQAELCEWMLDRLDTAGVPAAGEYRVAGSSEGIVRVFAPANAATPKALQELVNRVRSESQSPRVFPVASRSAVVFRGTSSQTAIADVVMKDR